MPTFDSAAKDTAELVKLNLELVELVGPVVNREGVAFVMIIMKNDQVTHATNVLKPQHVVGMCQTIARALSDGN